MSSVARLLVPSEHGTWAQLLFPLATALWLPGARTSAWLLAAAVVCAFTATESLQVLFGSRGSRAARELGPVARRTLASLMGGAAVCGAAALVSASPATRMATVALFVVGASAWLHVFRGGLKTTGGELHVAAALSCGALPVALAGEASSEWAFTIAGTWTAAFASATLAVRSVTARALRRPYRVHLASATVLAVASAFALVSLARAGKVPSLLPVAFLPTAAIVAVVAVAAPRAASLKRIGWCVVASSAILLIGLVVAGQQGAGHLSP